MDHNGKGWKDAVEALQHHKHSVEIRTQDGKSESFNAANCTFDYSNADVLSVKTTKGNFAIDVSSITSVFFHANS